MNYTLGAQMKMVVLATGIYIPSILKFRLVECSQLDQLMSMLVTVGLQMKVLFVEH